MTNIIEGILDCILKMFCGAADMLGNGILGLLCIDIGSSGSIFDIVFSSFGDIMGFLKVIAYAFVCINLVWQLFRIFVTPEGSGDTVFSLVARSIFAGALIGGGEAILRAFETLFNQFYNQLLTVSIDGADLSAKLSFTGVASSLWETVTGASDTDLGAGGLLLVFLLSVLIMYQFVMYMIEIVERYVVLGVLYYTSPLAYSMVGSKSTGTVFAAWIRMVGSQMFLMVCNVIFFRLFLQGMSNFQASINDIQTAHPDASSLSVAIVWCLLLSGILNVGQKVDSYLGTLGLSAAQTGRGLASALVASTLGVGRIMRGGASAGSKIANSKAGQWVGGKAKDGVGRVMDRFRRKNGSLGEPAKHDGVTGSLSADSIVNKINGKAKGKESGDYQGQQAAQGYINAAGGSVPQSTMQGIDGNSFRMNEDGSIQMKWNAGKENEATITGVPVSGPNASTVDTVGTAGRMVTLSGENGEKLQLFTTASGAGAQDYLTQNPAMNSKMADYAKQSGQTAQEIAPGVWQTTQTDAAGNIISAQQYASANTYGPDAAMGSHVERIGGMDYHVSDITPTMAGAPRMETPISQGMSAADCAASIQTQFPTFASTTPTQITPDAMGANSGAFTFKDQATGTTWAVASTTDYALNPSVANNAQTIYAANGAAYTAVPIQKSEDISQTFLRREGVQYDKSGAPTPTSVYAPQLHTVTDVRNFTQAAKPSIFREASRRNMGKEKKSDQQSPFDPRVF